MSLFVISIFLLGFAAKLSEGRVHYVGERDGWVLSPFESYNHWTRTRRFQVNDTLVFTYQKGDSVLVVNETDYNICNPTNPNQSMHGGYSVFKLDRSGPFFFISGAINQCYQAQKMIIVVMAPRPYLKPPVISPFPSEALPPAQPPSAGMGITPASAPSFGGGISIAPANAPSGIVVAPGPFDEGDIGFAPAYGPTQPQAIAGTAFTTRVSWFVFGLVFMVFV